MRIMMSLLPSSIRCSPGTHEATSLGLSLVDDLFRVPGGWTGALTLHTSGADFTSVRTTKGSFDRLRGDPTG